MAACCMLHAILSHVSDTSGWNTLIWAILRPTWSYVEPFEPDVSDTSGWNTLYNLGHLEAHVELC